MKVAVVILNWNGAELLRRFLPSVVRNSPNASVFVIDNASTDDSLSILREFPTVKIIKNNQNYGYAKGYNLGLQNVEADIFCLLNSDVEVTEGWLEPMTALFKAYPDAAAAQPKIKDAQKPDFFEYAGAGGGQMDYLGYPYCRGRVYRRIEKDIGQYDDTTPISWASGACFFVRRDAFFEAGGFDTAYGSYQEEIDLCWRLRHLGYEILYNGHSCVYHLGSGTFGAENPRKTFYNFRNSLFTIVKNMPKANLWFAFPARLCLDGLVGILFALKMQPRHTLAIVSAHMSFYKNFKKMLAKRQPAHRSRFKYYSSYSIFLDYCRLAVSARKQGY